MKFPRRNRPPATRTRPCSAFPQTNTLPDRGRLALAWQREQEAFRVMAERRGCTVEELLKRGLLADETG
ncbi:hypothetical protein [Streptomyces sp. NBC_01518]|uniref:hypothetical protein n=1 Tax=Streptomyces sp. NBC_01518 TaxID=2903891 RepID=UPI00386FD6A0